MKPLYDLLYKNFKFHWNTDLETLFQQIKTFITEDVTLTLPNTNHPLFITVDSSLIGIGFVLFQLVVKGKLVIISHNSRIFTTNEQKL